MNENKRIDNPRIKSQSAWAPKLKNNNRRNYQFTKFSGIDFVLTDRRNLSGTQQNSACVKSSSCRFLSSAARNASTKATEYISFGFRFRNLVSFLFQESLNVTVFKRYEFFSVLAAIRENSDKRLWIENGEGFAVHSSS